MKCHHAPKLCIKIALGDEATHLHLRTIRCEHAERRG